MNSTLSIGHAATNKGALAHRLGLASLDFVAQHGAPLVFLGLLWWVLWWGHTPQVLTVDDAMRHLSWVGVIALVYVALQARAVLAQPRSGVVHSRQFRDRLGLQVDPAWHGHVVASRRRGSTRQI